MELNVFLLFFHFLWQTLAKNGLIHIWSSGDYSWLFRFFCLLTFLMTNILDFHAGLDWLKMVFKRFSNDSTIFFDLISMDESKKSQTNTYKLARVCEKDQHKKETSCVIIDFIPLHFYSYFKTILWILFFLLEHRRFFQFFS